MKASVGFIFFMLLLAGLAFVNLRSMQDRSDNSVVGTDRLVSSTWQPVRLGEMRIADDTRMFIQFEADGRAFGHSGCNRFTGQFDLNDGELNIGPLAGTRMACPEPAMSFELSFHEALDSASSASATEQFLTLNNALGDTVMRLTAIERVAAE